MLFPPAFAAATPDAGNAPRAPVRRRGPRVPRGGARRSGLAGGEGGVERRDRRRDRERRSRVPGSRIFAWSRELFSFRGRLGRRPAGAHGYEGGYDDDDRAYGFGGIAPAHRRLDPRKRLARRRVVEENARRSGRARREQLKLTEHLASVDMDSGATPTRIVMHPLTPTAAWRTTEGAAGVGLPDGEGAEPIWGRVRARGRTQQGEGRTTPHPPRETRAAAATRGAPARRRRIRGRRREPPADERPRRQPPLGWRATGACACGATTRARARRSSSPRSEALPKPSGGARAVFTRRGASARRLRGSPRATASSRAAAAARIPKASTELRTLEVGVRRRWCGSSRAGVCTRVATRTRGLCCGCGT